MLGRETMATLLVAFCGFTTIVRPAFGNPFGPYGSNLAPVDQERSILDIGTQGATGQAATLSCRYGFTGLSFHLNVSPYDLLEPQGLGWVDHDKDGNPAQTAYHEHAGWDISIDLNDGVGPRNGFVDWDNYWPWPTGPTSMSVSTTYGTSNPPSSIAWSITERRRWRFPATEEVYGPPPTGQLTDGTAGIYLLPEPDEVWVEEFPGCCGGPIAEPITMTGYVSGVVDRPVLIVEGFDSRNTNYPSRWLGTIIENGIMSILQASGYDVYVVDFADASISMRDNASRLMGAFESMKNWLDQNAPPSPTPPIRVVGLSMGGVITRRALATMEANGVDHGCDMFISMDAPQQGAWLNIDFQQWLEDNEDTASIVSVFADQLKVPVSAELLRCNMFDWSGGVPPMGTGEIEGTPTYVNFYTETNAINGDGYPHLTRNIGVSFGEGDIANKDLMRNRPFSHIGAQEIATLDVKLSNQTIISTDIEFAFQDIVPGSLQPAFQPLTIEDQVVVWGGYRLLIWQVVDPIFAHYRLTLGQAGAPDFIWSTSALDLWGVDYGTGPNSPDVIDWDYSKFDEIYVNPVDDNKEYWHNEISPTIGSILVDKLLEGPQFVYPNILAPNDGETWPVGETRRISWEYIGLDQDVSVTVFKRPVNGAWVDISNEVLLSDDYADWTVTGPDGVYELKVETTHPYSGVESDIIDTPLTVTTPSILAPVTGQLHASGDDLGVEWVLLSASSIDIAVSLDGGQTWPVNHTDAAYSQCPPNPLNGCYVFSGFSSASTECVVRVTSHQTDGSVVQFSDEFTSWDILGSSVQPVVTTYCQNGVDVVKLDVSWQTSLATDAGADRLEVWTPSHPTPGVGTPSSTTTGGNGSTTHQLIFQAQCQTGLFYYRISSQKSTGVVSENYVFNVQSCASCSPCPPPGCELN